MATVFLTSATDPDDEHGRLELQYLQDSAERDRFGVHEAVEEPGDADLILFVEREHATGAGLDQVREHPLVHESHSNCYVVNPRYKGIPHLPGVYASVPKKWYDQSRVRSSHYPEVRENEAFRDQGPVPEEGHLYSFRGKIGTAPVRSRIAELSHSRGVIRDTTDEDVTPMMKMRGVDPEIREYMQRYAHLIGESKFVLCPRGLGPSSLRIFEAMLMGRAPVIISDQWVPPEGPDWEAFSVRIPESEIDRIPPVLKNCEDRAAPMGRKARTAWEEWFSPEVTFHRVVEWCLDVHRTRPSLTDRWRRLRSYAYAATPVQVLEDRVLSHLASRAVAPWS